MHQSNMLSFLPVVFALVTASAGCDSSGAADSPLTTESSWRRRSTLRLYGEDGFHPSRMGTYLAALVMFERLIGRSPVKSAALTEGIQATDLLFLKQAADQGNRNFERP